MSRGQRTQATISWCSCTRFFGARTLSWREAEDIALSLTDRRDRWRQASQCPQLFVLAFELGIHGDVGFEHARYRTAFLGVFGRFGKLCLVRARDLRRHLKMDGGDGESRVQLFQSYGRCGIKRLRGHPGVAELG